MMIIFVMSTHYRHYCIFFFFHMLTDGLVEANKFTLPCVLKACAKLARWKKDNSFMGLL